MLKEKQMEIEHLHKERDLERQRVTRAANQADQAEQAVVSLKQEHEKVHSLSQMSYFALRNLITTPIHLIQIYKTSVQRRHGEENTRSTVGLG